MRINKVIPTQDDKIYDHSINKRNYIHTFCQKKAGTSNPKELEEKNKPYTSTCINVNIMKKIYAKNT
jgi:hypothetical protein